MHAQVVDVERLLRFYDKGSFISAKRLSFEGVGGRDVFNITAPFKALGRDYIAGRVEPRKSWAPEAIFFSKKGSAWVPDTRLGAFPLEDPFLSALEGVVVFGGVSVLRSSNGKVLSYKTVFFRGAEISGLKKFAEGPAGMKDIRIVSLPDGVGLFTRPQGGIGGKGRIGFKIVDSVDALASMGSSGYLDAEIITKDVAPEVWLGANAAYALKNGKLGVLGHIACYSPNHSDKNYYPITFCFDHNTMVCSGFKIVARRVDLPEGESKRKELRNALFPGGLLRGSDGTAKLYVGAGDAETYEIVVKDPFLEYER